MALPTEIKQGCEKPELKIAIDIDGVLADIHTRWCQLFNERTGRHTTIRDIKRWTFWNDFGITEEEFMNIHAQIWDDWPSIPPTEEALAEKIKNIQPFGIIDILSIKP